MRRVIIFVCFCTYVFGHGGHNEELKDKDFMVGAFANFSYRNVDLYPKGIEQANGYDSHGQPKEIVLEHIGGYVSAKMDDYLFNIELNHHAQAKWSANELIEKLHIGYQNESGSLKMGRDSHDISFLDTKEWGYGFAVMPLCVDSFFDETLVGNGVFGVYTIDRLKLSASYMEDMYKKKGRKTLKASYDFGGYKFVSYMQAREKTQGEEDFSNIEHTHSHGTGCDSLSGGELCVSNESSLYGVGVQARTMGYEVLGEYVVLKNKGDVNDNEYKIKHQTNVVSTYLQVLSQNEQFNYGIRSEFFWYDQQLDGAGASVIANKMRLKSGNDSMDYIHTIAITYKIDSYQKVFLENSYSNNDSAIRINYLISLNRQSVVR